MMRKILVLLAVLTFSASMMADEKKMYFFFGSDLFNMTMNSDKDGEAVDSSTSFGLNLQDSMVMAFGYNVAPSIWVGGKAKFGSSSYHVEDEEKTTSSAMTYGVGLFAMYALPMGMWVEADFLFLGGSSEAMEEAVGSGTTIEVSGSLGYEHMLNDYLSVSLYGYAGYDMNSYTPEGGDAVILTSGN